MTSPDEQSIATAVLESMREWIPRLYTGNFDRVCGPWRRHEVFAAIDTAIAALASPPTLSKPSTEAGAVPHGLNAAWLEWSANTDLSDTDFSNFSAGYRAALASVEAPTEPAPDGLGTVFDLLPGVRQHVEAAAQAIRNGEVTLSPTDEQEAPDYLNATGKDIWRMGFNCAMSLALKPEPAQQATNFERRPCASCGLPTTMLACSNCDAAQQAEPKEQP